MRHTKMLQCWTLPAVAALAIGLAAPAYADPDDSDGPDVTNEICGAFDLGVPPGDNILHCETTEMAPGDGVNLVAINADN